MNTEPATRKFTAILADPPWQYRDKCNSGKRGASHKYPVLSQADMKRLRVQDLSADDACLFLWATAPMLPEALEVMKAWGFKYKTIAFVWSKLCRVSHDRDFVGMGHYTRANAELVLLGVRGHPHRVSASVRQIVRCPVLRHSEKPAVVRERIVQLLGDVPRIELFARTKAEGWSSWGNEVESDVELGMMSELEYTRGMLIADKARARGNKYSHAKRLKLLNVGLEMILGKTEDKLFVNKQVTKLMDGFRAATKPPTCGNVPEPDCGPTMTGL